MLMGGYDSASVLGLSPFLWNEDLPGSLQVVGMYPPIPNPIVGVQGVCRLSLLLLG